MKKPPEILATKTLARTRLFHIEQVGLRFANGVAVEFERLRGSPRGAVLVVPVLPSAEVLLIREYAAGVERYELSLPKGRIDGEEPLHEAANRELMEEVGYGARDLRHLCTFTLAPGYSSQITEVILAQDLYPQRLEGDEPEPLEVVHWPLADISGLIATGDLTEARSIAALYRAREVLGL